MSTSLTFYGGINEIGGNKILLEDSKADTKLFLDFGLNYSEYGKYFEEYMKPRVGNGITDLVELGLLPHPKKLQGFYRIDMLKIGNYPIHDEPDFDGILLSHAHFDHSAYITFADERIPVYSSEITIAILKALLECGNPSFDTEIYAFKRRPSKRGQPRIERNWQKVESGKKFKVGNLEVKPFSVDHSIPGAMSYLIYTSEGTIFYSGDFRMHGTYGYLTKKMLEEIEDEEVDLMLCEGTRINDVENQSEELVKKRSHEVISNCNELVIADYAFKDLTRFNTFYEIAKENDRKLAIQLKDAYLIKELRHLIKLPDITKDENILIYLDKRRSGTYCEEDYDKKWMKEIYKLDNIIPGEEIHKRQEEIIVRLSFWDLNELIDMKPNRGSQYIHSMCEPFNEEMAISEKRLKNWLKHFSLPYNHIHCSGHANALELEETINLIKPKKLLPIHTENPEMFKDLITKIRNENKEINFMEMIIIDKERNYKISMENE